MTISLRMQATSATFGFFPSAISQPEPIIAELEKNMDSGEASLSHDVVKFQSMSRPNAILVVSRKPAINRAFPGFSFLLGSEGNPHAILDALH